MDSTSVDSTSVDSTSVDSTSVDSTSVDSVAADSADLTSADSADVHLHLKRTLAFEEISLGIGPGLAWRLDLVHFAHTGFDTHIGCHWAGLETGI